MSSSPTSPGTEGAGLSILSFVLGATLPFAMELDRSRVSKGSVKMPPVLQGLH